jgi:hypothetical protein
MPNHRCGEVLAYLAKGNRASLASLASESVLTVLRLMMLLMLFTLLFAWPGQAQASAESARSAGPTSTPPRQQPAVKPFGLPFADAPGPTTWLLSQGYGNTIGAFNYGRYWYAGGQHLHFGVDFAAPCGTPVLAIGDGEVDQVDNFSFGLEPHNLTIFHRDQRLTSVYGHLNAKSTLLRGQPVRRGDVIGYSGDPDRTCQSRPHLHLEVRDSRYEVAFNPQSYIEADWEMLSSIGYHLFGGYVKDLTRPNRWQIAALQPDIDFNEAPVNEYAQSWPPPARSQPPPYTRPAFVAPPLAGEPSLTLVSRSGCCSWAWWSPDSLSIRYWDGPDGQPAAIYTINATGGASGQAAALPAPQVLDTTPFQMRSADDRYRIEMNGGRASIVTPDGVVTPLATGGAWPQFSPTLQRLLWHRHPADNIPGSLPPATEIWVSALDGSSRQLVKVQQGGAVYWLDEDRLLLVEPIGRTYRYILSLYTLSTGRSETMLPEAGYLRGLAVAPGGQHVLIYAPFQQDPTGSGLYLLATRANTDAIKLPMFGSYRWRDSRSFLYIPFTPGQPARLMRYDINTGENVPVTDPTRTTLRIANDDWSVSPDGRAVLFWDAGDFALRVLRWE